MPYGRFLREAEPYKVSACESCGSKLRRSRMVCVLLLLLMIIVLGLIVLMIYPLLEKAQSSLWLNLFIFIVLLAGWVLLTNYLGWRLIGWVTVEQTKKT